MDHTQMFKAHLQARKYPTPTYDEIIAPKALNGLKPKIYLNKPKRYKIVT